MPKQAQKYTKMVPQRGGNDVKKIFSISDDQSYTKNACTKFHGKILNSYDVLEEHSPK